MFVVGFYTFFPLSAWSWFWSFLVLVLLAFAAAVVVGLEVEERTGTGQDKMGQARLLLFSGRNTHTNKNSSYKQCLALNPHPLRLELLAHVGYVVTNNLPNLRRKRANSQTTAITFLAQWHPLIAPQRNDLRPEYNGAAVKSNGMF